MARPKEKERKKESDDGNLEGSTTPMVDMGMYELKHLNTGKITPKELFMNAYEDEINESEQVSTSSK